MKVEANRQSDAVEWLKRRRLEFVPPFVTLALMDGETIRAVAVFNGFQQSNIDLSIITDGPIPLTRAHLRALFHYPFVQLKLNRVSVRTDAENLPVRKHIRRLGFKPEGKQLKFYGDNAAMIYGLLRQDCKWL